MSSAHSAIPVDAMPPPKRVTVETTLTRESSARKQPLGAKLAQLTEAFVMAKPNPVCVLMGMLVNFVTTVTSNWLLYSPLIG